MIYINQVADRIREALAPLEEKIDVAVIFGSWARGNQQPDSDIDLLMIGDVPLQEISKALQDVGREPGREINPVVMSPEEFRQRLSDGDHFA
ncbi:MAG: nucleotidyltransferase domain-containing protein, partial [Armatimonadota bacterium]